MVICMYKIRPEIVTRPDPAAMSGLGRVLIGPPEEFGQPGRYFNEACLL